MASIGKVFDLFDVDEEIESSNVNGWAMEVLGKLPEEGDSFTEYGLAVEILETTGKRVEKLKITDVRVDEDEDEEKREKKKSADDEDSSEDEVAKTEE